MEANYIHTPIAMAFNQAEKDNDYANIVRYKRLLYAHLSVETATKTLNGFDLSETQSIFITHLSTSDKFLGDELKFYMLIKRKLKKTPARLFICYKNPMRDGCFHTGSI